MTNPYSANAERAAGRFWSLWQVSAVREPRIVNKRKRGSYAADRATLEERYNLAKKRRRPTIPLLDFRAAVLELDPLGQIDPSAVEHLYGIADSNRPNVAARNVYKRLLYDPLWGVTELARHFRLHQRFTDLRAAEEAVALAAERGIWIGAPVSFEKAVDMVRRAVARKRPTFHELAAEGFTGRFLWVVPRDPALPILYPMTRQQMAFDGAWVPDTLYWRRIVRDGDLLLGAPPEKKDQ